MEFLKRFVHQPGAMLPECHAATLVELTDGTLLCAWYAEAFEGAADVAIYGAALSPGETGWTSRGVFASTPGFSEGNPVLFLDGRERLWLFYVTMLRDRWDTCQVKYTHSYDGGDTWTAPHFLRMDWGWMTGCKPLLRPNGALLLPLNHEKGTGFVLRSEDGGLHWNLSSVPATEQRLIQPTIAPLSDGTLRMYLRNRKPVRGPIWQSASVDEGQTWSPPTPTDLPNPNARIDITTLASGRLALAFNDAPENRTPLTLALSEDDGRTWPYRYDIETEAGEYSYPALIQARDGRLHLAYSWQRTHIAHLVCDEEYLMAHARQV